MFQESLPIDSLPEDPRSGEPPAPTWSIDALHAQYQLIGEALMICEAGSYRVGNPWLPPTGRVRDLLEKFAPADIEDFVRCALVSVPTPALESYCEDLEPSREGTLGQGRTEANDLFISDLTFFERYSFSALLFGIFFSTNFLISSALGVETHITLLSAWVAAGFAGFAGTVLSGEPYRRRTFHCLLTREIMRRQGLNQPGANGITVTPV